MHVTKALLGFIIGQAIVYTILFIAGALSYLLTPLESTAADSTSNSTREYEWDEDLKALRDTQLFTGMGKDL